MVPYQKKIVGQLFEQLQGLWQIERTLGNQGSMQGTALFCPYREQVLYYTEQGIATLKGKSRVSVYREYAYVYEQDTLSVYFWDQRQNQPAELLHRLQFYYAPANTKLLVATGTHWCALDTYRGCYQFLDQEHFQLTYQVQGPRKDYTIQTQFKKTQGDDNCPDLYPPRYLKNL